MRENQPETFGQYFQLKWRELIEWVKPNDEDSLTLKVVKTFFKGIVMIILMAVSPVLIIALFIAFVTAF